MAAPAEAAGLHIDTDTVKIHIFPCAYCATRISMAYSGVYTQGQAWVRGCDANFVAPHGGQVNMEYWRTPGDPVLLSDEKSDGQQVRDEGMDGIAEKLKKKENTFTTVASFKAWVAEWSHDIDQLCADLDKLFSGAPAPAIFVEQKSNPDCGVYFCDNMPPPSQRSSTWTASRRRTKSRTSGSRVCIIIQKASLFYVIKRGTGSSGRGDQKGWGSLSALRCVSKATACVQGRCR